jgi:DNA-binding NtrC family response regulator
LAVPSSKPRIGVVDNDEDLRASIVASLRSEYEVLEGDDFEAAYNLLQGAQLDVLILAIPMPSGGVRECCELLARLVGSEIDTLVIVLSDDQKKSTALKVIDAGSYDYFSKPLNTEVLAALLRRAIEKLHLQRENRILRTEVTRKHAAGDLIGSTDSMKHLLENVRRMAKSNANVVIRGESGTGKELVARALHEQGPRRSRPFISVNCAALPESLMEAELFGYERGAFTGAVATKEGRVELANKGTLFLDEIATLTPGLQSKLLRVLEERSVLRLGGKKSIKVDFRLVSATNEDLEAMVQDERFREDLYYRINVVPIIIPPLRERTEDIPVLLDYFLGVYCAANQTGIKRLSDEALQSLVRYSWPGNVRELQNVVQRLVLMTDGDLIEPEHLPGDVQAAGRKRKGAFYIPADGVRLEKEVDAFEKQWVEAALNQAKQVKTEAARLLGVDRNRINYLCRKHGM